MRVLVAAVLAGAALPGPTTAALQPGSRATIDVAVATLWKAPAIHRPLDRPSTTNPVDPVAWSRNLATTELRVWLDSHVQTQALYGQNVVVLARRGAWAKVAVVDEPDPQDPRGYPGWVPLVQLKSGTVAGDRYVVALARTPSVDVGGRTLVVSYGTRLPLVRWTGDAALVRTPDGPGTVAGGDWSEPVQPSGASIVAQAKRFIGVHYLWGGLSAWGFDCSGLVWDVYRAHGMTIPRDADPQFRHGTPVAANALRPGDLLFYGTQRYVHHVAIYAGDGRMVEAPDSAHSVRLVPVRWRGFAGARRY
ncbi:MAG: NlpC/P60 family protein [Actinobacteria bacterium]|nr:MAG: NlpC/P60 family protein [Actinomycetota bacterium]